MEMRKILRLIIPIAFCFIIAPTNFVSAESESELHEGNHHQGYFAELFLGNTYEHGENGFSFGLLYEYRRNKLFGVGGFWEYAAGDFDKWSVGLPLFIHPYKGFRFFVAPGFEHKDSENEFLFRTGGSYEFEVGRWARVM